MNITFIDTEITVKGSEFVAQFNLEGNHVNATGTYNFDGEFPNIETVDYCDENDNPVLFGIADERLVKIHIEVQLNEDHRDHMYQYWASYNTELEYADY